MNRLTDVVNCMKDMRQINHGLLSVLSMIPMLLFIVVLLSINVEILGGNHFL